MFTENELLTTVPNLHNLQTPPSTADLRIQFSFPRIGAFCTKSNTRVRPGLVIKPTRFVQRGCTCKMGKFCLKSLNRGVVWGRISVFASQAVSHACLRLRLTQPFISENLGTVRTMNKKDGPLNPSLGRSSIGCTRQGSWRRLRMLECRRA